ncbi:NAD-dependent histone deacetylase SIR2, partial [Microthyrium microscopicum]
MGQDESKLIDDSTPPQWLAARTISALASFISDGKAQRMVLMTGAGISTSAGIPDFRSPETGIYANLARLNLPYPEALFDISYFRTNPEPFYALAHELYPGRYEPTVTHNFIALLYEKGLLHMLYTQNIDCLEREAGVPDEVIVEAHGSFKSQRCIECGVEFPEDIMRLAVEESEVPHCMECAGLIKPDITFFGEGLPERFFTHRRFISEADLCIVMGTSLSVAPFSTLPTLVPDSVPRLLINADRVGDLGSRPDDVLLLGDCDEGVRRLAGELGWLEELEARWALTSPKQAAKWAETKGNLDSSEGAEKSNDEKLQDEVNELTKEIDQALKDGETRRKTLQNGLLKDVDDQTQN